MDRFLTPRLNALKTRLLQSLHVCLAMLRLAGGSLLHLDVRQAQAVLDAGPQAEAARLSMEEQLVSLLALGKPVARDLRLLVALMRVCGHSAQLSAGNARLAEQALRLAARPLPEAPAALNQALDRSAELLGLSIKAFASLDTGLALLVRELAQASSAGRSLPVLACSTRDGWAGAVEVSALSASAVVLEQVAGSALYIADQARFAVGAAQEPEGGPLSRAQRRDPTPGAFLRA